MTVPAQSELFNSSTANGLTSDFPFSFKILSADDIVVMLDGVIQTSGFTLSGVASDTGGTVSFAVAPVNGTIVTRYLDVSLKRDKDYQQFGDWLASVVNGDFDRVILGMQSLKRQIERAIKFPANTSGDQTISEDPAQRANTAVGFDVVGNLALLPLQIGTSLIDLAAAGGSALVGFVQSGIGSITRSTQSKLREIISVKDKGAACDGVADDTAPWNSFVDTTEAAGAQGFINPGTLKLGAISHSPSGPLSLKGAGAYTSKLKRASGVGSFFYVVDGDGGLYQDFGIDNGYATTLQAGHGLVLQNCMNQRVRGVNIEGIGNADEVSAGTAIMSLPTLTTGTVRNIVYQDMHLKAAAGNVNTVGSLIVDGRYCRQSGLLVEDFTHFGAEYKEDTRYSLASDIIAVNCKVALGYGQSSVGVDGCDYNAASNIVAHECTQAITVGEGEGNIFSNIIAKAETTVDAYGVDHSSDSIATVVTNLLTSGDGIKYPVRYRGSASRCYTSVASHDSAANIITLDVGATKNVTEVLHPGTRTAIAPYINDVSGNGLSGTAANVTFCHATGEYLGSLSGYWLWAIGHNPAASYGSLQKWRYESDVSALAAFSTPGGASDSAGIQVNKGATSNYAGFIYSFGTDYWSLRVASTNVARFAVNLWRPENDNGTSLGNGSSRFSVVYAGTGTINTSDAREKQQVSELSAKEKAVAKKVKQLIRSFKFNDAVQTKGNDARIHFGVMAQDVVAAFSKEGLDARKYALLCYDEWPEQPEIIDEDGNVTQAYRAAGNRYGVRYEELLCFIISAL